MAAPVEIVRRKGRLRRRARLHLREISVDLLNRIESEIKAVSADESSREDGGRKSSEVTRFERRQEAADHLLHRVAEDLASRGGGHGDPPGEVDGEDAIHDAIQDDGGLRGQGRLIKSEPRFLEIGTARFDG